MNDELEWRTKFCPTCGRPLQWYDYVKNFNIMTGDPKQIEKVLICSEADIKYSTGGHFRKMETLAATQENIDRWHNRRFQIAFILGSQLGDKPYRWIAYPTNSELISYILNKLRRWGGALRKP